MSKLLIVSVTIALAMQTASAQMFRFSREQMVRYTPENHVRAVPGRSPESAGRAAGEG